MTAPPPALRPDPRPESPREPRPDPRREPPPAAAIDGFPFRHRVAEVMTSPVATIAPDATLAAAAAEMRARAVSSLIAAAADGRPLGILTERDVVRALGDAGAGAAAAPVSAWMSSPIASVPADAFVAVAMGRMERLRLRHLGVVDAEGRLVGMTTARSLLKLRSERALLIGDAVAGAADAAELRAAHDQIPALARALRAEGLGVGAIAAVIAGAARDMTARAGELAEAELAAAGAGAPPAPYALLVLGSGGRGECLLTPDQDNAIVHAGGPEADPWLARLGARVADILDAAGLPYCKGGVMAREPAWRRSQADWIALVESWAARPDGAAVLNADIFFDGRAVLGERSLSTGLYGAARRIAAASRPFLLQLALSVGEKRAPLGLFGGLRLGPDGRVDLKAGGTFPITAAARVLALKRGLAAKGTAERLAQLALAEAIPPVDAARLGDALATIQGAILDQQLDDLAAGIAPSVRVDPARLDKPARERLTEALRRVGSVEELVRAGLSD